jgi:hypothetical protein
MRVHGTDGKFVPLPAPVCYCDCPTPLPSWWNVQCGWCGRLIEGAIEAVLARG